LRSRLWYWLKESCEVFAVRFWRHPRRSQSVVENVGVTFTPRSVVDDRWQEGFSSLVHTSFAISAAFFFWKRVKTNPLNPSGKNPERKIQYENQDPNGANASSSRCYLIV